MKYTMRDNSEAAIISDFLLDNFAEAKRRMWNQFSEVKSRMEKAKPNQEALSNTRTDNIGKPGFLYKRVDSVLENMKVLYIILMCSIDFKSQCLDEEL